MTALVTDEVKSLFAPWAAPDDRLGAPPTSGQSYEATEARYPWLAHWGGPTPQAYIAARYHPDHQLRWWLNALISSAESRYEVGKRREAGLVNGSRKAEPAQEPGRGWAEAYD